VTRQSPPCLQCGALDHRSITVAPQDESKKLGWVTTAAKTPPARTRTVTGVDRPLMVMGK
jgi:hypothetical protein